MPISTAQEIIAVKAPDIPQDTRLDDLIDIAKLNISEAALKNKYQLSLALLVLHWTKLDQMSGGVAGDGGSSGSGASGGLRKKKEGRLEIEFQAPTPSTKDSQNYYNQTIFGAELYTLWRGCFTLFTNRCV